MAEAPSWRLAGLKSVGRAAGEVCTYPGATIKMMLQVEEHLAFVCERMNARLGSPFERAWPIEYERIPSWRLAK